MARRTKKFAIVANGPEMTLITHSTIVAGKLSVGKVPGNSTGQLLTSVMELVLVGKVWLSVRFFISPTGKRDAYN